MTASTGSTTVAHWANGHRWPCTKFYDTAPAFARCTCPRSRRARVEEAIDKAKSRRWRWGR